MPDFGKDVYCISAIDKAFTLNKTTSVLSESIARRLMTPRGSLYFCPNYGEDVREYLHEGITRETLALRKAAIEAQCELDERVDSCEATLEFSPTTQVLSVMVRIVHDTGVFTLVLGITDVTVTILSTTTG